LNAILKEEIVLLLEENNSDLVSSFEDNLPTTPYVIMVVGVNGVGKTTTIGKLAHHFKQGGKKVVLGAADTFRAAAVDQLSIWADRVGVEIVKQDMGSDPASVAFDTLSSAVSGNADVVIIDTAGRLHNKVNLMNELTKIRRVMQKVIPEAPHEILLILDGSTGQNAFEQAKDYVLDKGYDIQYGARPLKRAIQKYLEDPMAETIIKSTLVEGDTMLVDFDKENEEITVAIQKKKALPKTKEKKELPESKKELPEAKKELPEGEKPT